MKKLIFGLLLALLPLTSSASSTVFGSGNTVSSIAYFCLQNGCYDVNGKAVTIIIYNDAAPLDLSSTYANVDGTIYNKSTEHGFSNPQEFFTASGVTSFTGLTFDTSWKPTGQASTTPTLPPSNVAPSPSPTPTPPPAPSPSPTPPPPAPIDTNVPLTISNVQVTYSGKGVSTIAHITYQTSKQAHTIFDPYYGNPVSDPTTLNYSSDGGGDGTDHYGTLGFGSGPYYTRIEAIAPNGDVSFSDDILISQ